MHTPKRLFVGRPLSSDRLGETRTVHLYRPPTDEPCPLLVVFDGVAYIEHGRLPHIVDNLITQERIRPVNMAFVDNGGQARVVEYACSDATVRFVEWTILPLAREHLVPGVEFDVTDYLALAQNAEHVVELVKCLRADRPTNHGGQGTAYIARTIRARKSPR